MSVQLFKEYFSGRTDVYGHANQFCIKEPLTDDILNKHLQGINRIGIYPIFDDNLTNWIAIDIDKQDFNLARDFVIAAKGYDIKAYIERSKSKGQHCWMFFDAPVKAIDARLVVECIQEEIGLVCEVFPKQDEVEKNSFGNFIFLPLFGESAKQDKTVFVNLNNKVVIKSSDKLHKIDKNKSTILKEIIEVNKLERKEISRTSTISPDRVVSKKEPPCITKIRQGVKRGHRNESAFRLAIFFKERGLGPEEISTLLLSWNDKNENPTDKSKRQTEKELLRVVDSVFKGDYKSFGCDSGVIADYCDKTTCPLVLAQDKKAQIEQGVIVQVFRDPATLVYRKKNYEYRLTNMEFMKTGKFKCCLTLLRDAKIIYKDTISFDKASSRKKYVTAAKDEEIDFDIMKIEDLAKTLLAKEEKAELDKPKQLYIMTEDEKNAAIKFLEATPHLLDSVIKITNKMGIVGEEAVRLMIYLCFTSRITANPLSVTIKGESSSGKSYVPMNVKKLVPEEGVYFISRATENAFYHLPEDGMMHRIIWVSELSGSESADYSIRTAQSEGNLVVMMPQKNPQTGEIVTTTKTVKGPVGFLITTTKTTLFNENETRNFSVFTDDSPMLTKRIGAVTIKKAFGDTFEIEPETLNLYKNFQRLLNPDFTVIMPFAFEVFSNFPDKPVRIRRDKERFRCLIEIITILHQFHRKQTKNELTGVTYIEATLADYYLAKVIAEQTLLETIYEIGPSSRLIWDTLIDLKEKYSNTPSEDMYADADFTFTYKDLMEALDWKYEKTKKWTMSLLKAGFLDFAENSSGGRGKKAHYRLVKDNIGPLATMFLPSVKDLYDKYPCSLDLLYNPLNGGKVDDILK